MSRAAALREFFAIRRPTWRGVASAYAVSLGLLMLYGGVGHTIAVTAVHVRAGRAYDFRFASLLVTGVVLVYGALANLVLARWIAAGRRWALAWSPRMRRSSSRWRPRAMLPDPPSCSMVLTSCSPRSR